MRVEFNRDWREFLSLLTVHHVRFLLIGGHAVAGHAEARLTEDLDVLVEPTTGNAGRLREALVAFGFGTVAPAVAELATPDKVFMIGRKPWRIDILTSIAGVTFDEAWDGRIQAELDDATKIWVIGREALIKNKLAAGRDKDLRDVEALRQHAPRDEAPKRDTRRAKSGGNEDE